MSNTKQVTIIKEPLYKPKKNNIMKTYILQENCLSDNLLLIADKGNIFKGGYIAIIKEYTYQNEWSDKENIKKFRSHERLLQYINKNYKDFDQEI